MKILGVLSILVLVASSLARNYNLRLNSRTPSRIFASSRYPQPHSRTRPADQWKISSPANTDVVLVCFVRLRNSNTCRQAFLLIAGERICGAYSVFVRYPANSAIVKFKSIVRGTRRLFGFSCAASFINPESLVPTTSPPTTEPPTTVPTSTEPPTTEPTTTEPTSTEPPTTVQLTTEPTTTEPSTTDPSTTDCQCGIKDSNRIVGGEETDENEYPWQCWIISGYEGGGSSFCGCSLISSEWVLTAGHCVRQPNNINAISATVVLGDHVLNTTSENDIGISVSQIITHELYPGGVSENDIALIRLSTAVIFSNVISPVCLPFNDIFKNITGEEATAIGWGKEEYNGSLSYVLQDVKVPVISNDDCVGVYGSGVTENNICAGYDGHGVCSGDSGGPLLLENEGISTIVGIVSWGGIPCAQGTRIGVYVRVTQYLDWIQNKTGEFFCQ